MQVAMDVIRQYRLSEGLNRVSPYYMFSVITSVLGWTRMRPVPGHHVPAFEYQNGAIVSYLQPGAVAAPDLAPPGGHDRGIRSWGSPLPTSTFTEKRDPGVTRLISGPGYAKL